MRAMRSAWPWMPSLVAGAGAAGVAAAEATYQFPVAAAGGVNAPPAGRARCEVDDGAVGGDVGPRQRRGRRDGDVNDRRRHRAEQAFEIDGAEQVALGEVGEAMHVDAGRRARRREDAAVAAAPARDEGIEAGAHVVAGRRRGRRCRRRSGLFVERGPTAAPPTPGRAKAGPPALQRVDGSPAPSAAGLPVRPRRRARRGRAARERQAPGIVRRSRAEDDAAGRRCARRDERRDRVEGAADQLVVAAQRVAEPVAQGRGRVDDELGGGEGAPPSRRPARRRRGAPAEQADDVVSRWRRRGRERGEQRLSAAQSAGARTTRPLTSRRGIGTGGGARRGRGEPGALKGELSPDAGRQLATRAMCCARKVNAPTPITASSRPRAQLQRDVDRGEEARAQRREVDVHERHREARLDARAALADVVDAEADRRPEQEPVADGPRLARRPARRGDHATSTSVLPLPVMLRAAAGAGRRQVAKLGEHGRHGGSVVADEALPVGAHGSERVLQQGADRDRRDAGGRVQAEQDADRGGGRAEPVQHLVGDVGEDGRADLGDRVGARQVERRVIVAGDDDAVGGEQQRRLARCVEGEAGAQAADAQRRRAGDVDQGAAPPAATPTTSASCSEGSAVALPLPRSSAQSTASPRKPTPACAGHSMATVGVMRTSPAAPGAAGTAIVRRSGPSANETRSAATAPPSSDASCASQASRAAACCSTWPSQCARATTPSCARILQRQRRHGAAVAQADQAGERGEAARRAAPPPARAPGRGRDRAPTTRASRGRRRRG